MADHVDPLRPFDPAEVGPYRLLGRLGAGGMGEVFLGQDTAGRLAAVKLVHDEHADDPQFRTRFAREVRIARSVRIAGSAAIVDADPDAPVPWLATEYVAGPSLERLVTARGPMAEASVMVLASRLADTLAEMHELGVVHRDVKPSNVLVAADRPRLIDFGIARAAGATAITQSGMVLGAPGYMSPEQALGADAGPASDVFSFAAVVVYAVAGRGPFGAAGSPVALLRRIVDEHPDLEGVPDDMRGLVQACLAKDPVSRPTAVEVAARLEPHRSDGDWPPAGSMETALVTPDDPGRGVLGRRRFIRIAALGAVAAGALTGGGAAVRTAARSGAAGAGAIRWRFDAARYDPFEGVLYGGGHVIAHSRFAIYALDTHDGHLRWRTPAREVYDRPIAVTRGTCYSYDGRGIFALDAATGTFLWEQEGAEVLTATETVLLGRTAGSRDGGGELLGIEPGTGAIRWRHTVPPDETVTQVARSEGRLHVGFRQDLVTFDPVTGTVQWAIPWPSGYAHGGLDTHDGAVVLAQSDRLVSLDAATGTNRWSHPISNWYFRSPIVHSDTVLMSEPYQLAAVNADTGQPRWSIDPEKGDTTVFSPGPAGLGTTLYIAETPSDKSSAKSLQVWALDVVDGTRRWAIPITSSVSTAGTVTPLVAAGDSVCFATGNTVYAIGERA